MSDLDLDIGRHFSRACASGFTADGFYGLCEVLRLLIDKLNQPDNRWACELKEHHDITMAVWNTGTACSDCGAPRPPSEDPDPAEEGPGESPHREPEDNGGAFFTLLDGCYCS